MPETCLNCREPASITAIPHDTIESTHFGLRRSAEQDAGSLHEMDGKSRRGQKQSVNRGSGLSPALSSYTRKTSEIRIPLKEMER